ncbi:hypothetical protein GG344DRAFT_58910, partial [Lentinula edodes]
QKMGFQKFRLGHASAPTSHKKKRATDSSCLTGGFYTNPVSGATIDSLKTLNITWDTSCLTPSNDEVDIYLYAPSAATPRLHLWEDVPFSKGYYEAELMPRWWNTTSSEQLQLLILQSGDAPFLATLPAGPVFTATYSTPSSGTPESAQTSLASLDSGITEVQSTASTSSSSHLSGGKIAAAVIMPLLAVAALAVFFWIRRSRATVKEERKVWSEKVDQRMSVVSADWQSISPAGAQAAIRNSMAIRASMEAEARMSVAAVNLAGMGVQAPGGGVGGFFIPSQGDPTVNPIVAMPVPSFPATAQLRPGLRSSAYSSAAAAARVSRVSFAADPAIPGRPSGESRRSIYDRERPSFDSSQRHYSGEYSVQNEDGSREEGTMSPTQTMGPIALSTDDIKRRISMRQGSPSSGKASFDSGNDDVGPALTMMRAQEDDYFNHNVVMPGSPVSLPIVELPPTTSTSTFTGMAPPKNGMSPDDMLRAYAERKAAAGAVRAGTPKISNASPLAREMISQPIEEQESGKAM